MFLRAKTLSPAKESQSIGNDSDNKIGLGSILFQPINELLLKRIATSSSTSVDLLWQSAAFFKVHGSTRPNWSGFMQTVSNGAHPPKSTITMLPIIDLNPTDY